MLAAATDEEAEHGARHRLAPPCPIGTTPVD
jgi:hypothetical protein